MSNTRYTVIRHGEIIARTTSLDTARRLGRLAVIRDQSAGRTFSIYYTDRSGRQAFACAWTMHPERGWAQTFDV